MFTPGVSRVKGATTSPASRRKGWLRTAAAALTAFAGLAIATRAPAQSAHAVSNGIPDQELAYNWAPVWMQDTDSSNYRADYITRFDYDGDWYGINNWNNLNRYALPAYVYYNIAETNSHYYILYADFHPRDWHEWNTLDMHENDMEGVLVVIQKNGTRYGAFQLMITVAHHDFWSYKDYQSYPSSIVSNNRETIDGDVQFWGSHPYVYADAKSHAVHGDKRWEQSNYPGGDGVTYYPTYYGYAEQPSSGNDRYVPYQLTPLNDLWNRRYDYAFGYPVTFASYGTFRGDDGMDNSANAPWAWDDSDDGDIYSGDIYLRPAYLISRYHSSLGWVSNEYIYSTDGAYRW